MNYPTFLIKFALGTLALLTSVMAINLAFDPLWYAGGNKIGDYNYAFNERTSKLNLLSNAQFDCLILGSSRTTFLKPSEMTSKNCFNLAFSGGLVEEFSPFIRNLKANGMTQLDYLVVGVDGTNFFGPSKFDNNPLPEITEDPPGIFESYLSIDALDFSYRLHTQDANLPRYYNSNFEIEVLDKLPTFSPDMPLQGTIDGLFVPHKLELYKTLVKEAQAEEVVFYVPPLSAWHIKDLSQKGLLSDYITVLYQFVESGYTLLDYSVVSNITKNPANTYDGHHFLPAVNSQISTHLNQIMSGHSPKMNGFGVLVNDLSEQQYKELYRATLSQFDNSQQSPASLAGVEGSTK